MIENLVLEIREDESAADVQARLDRAGEDGFFLVSTIGRLAFLRKSIAVQKAYEGPAANKDDVLAVDFLKAHLSTKDRDIAAALKSQTGIVRSYKWFQRRRKDSGVSE